MLQPISSIDIESLCFALLLARLSVLREKCAIANDLLHAASRQKIKLIYPYYTFINYIIVQIFRKNRECTMF